MTYLKENVEKIFNKVSVFFAKFSDFFSKEAGLQAKLANIIITSSDPEELKNKIVREVAEALKASRCFIIEYDNFTNNFKKISNSYSYKRESKDILGYDTEKGIPNLAIKYKYMKSIVITNTESFVKKQRLEESKEEIFFKMYGVKSLVSVRLEFGEIFLGILTVYFDRKKPFLSYYELNFLKNIAEHISIALHLSKLYSQEKTEREREHLLRAMISIISKDFHLPNITQKIFELLQTLYNVQNLFIKIDIEGFKNNFVYSQIKTNEDRVDESKINSLFEVYKSGKFDLSGAKEYYLEDTHKFVIQNNLEKSVIDKYFSKNNVKSAMILPILHENSNYGHVIIQFDKPNPVTSDEHIFIKTVIEQFAIAVKQSHNYEMEKKFAQRENLFRNVTEMIRGNLDITQTKETIVNTLGKTLNADRCFIMEFDKTADRFLPADVEYLSSEAQKSYKHVDLNEAIPYLVSEFKKGKNLIFNEKKMTLDGKEININAINFEKEKAEIKEYKVYSAAVVPLFYAKEFLGDLVIHYADKKHETWQEEIDFINKIANQTAIAIYHANLYSITQKLAQREALLRQIVETSRSSLNLIEVKKKIVEEIGSAFGANRCFFRSYDVVHDKLFAPDVEYLSSDEVGSLMNVEPDQKALKYFVSEVLKNKKGFYTIYVNEKQAKNTVLENYTKSVGLKADYVIPIINRFDEILWLVLHYTEKDVVLSEEDKKLLETIAYQIDIAFEQINLYNSIKQIAQRESLIRKVNEEIRDTLNLDSTLHVICEEIANTFNVQSVVIVDFFLKNGYTEYMVKKIFKRHKDLQEFNFMTIDKDSAIHLDKGLLKVSNSFFINDISTSDSPDSFKFSSERIGLKSVAGAAIKKDKTKTGMILIYDYENQRIWSKEEIALLNTIADQIYIAVNQVELQNRTKQQIEREKAILNNLPFMIWLKNSEGILLTVNEPFAKICNSSVENVIGKTEHDFFLKEYADVSILEDKEVMLKKKTITSERLFKDAEGSHWYKIYKTPVLDERGNVIGITGFARDITQEKLQSS